MKIRFVYLYCCHTFCSHICAQQAFREWCVCCYCLLIMTFSSDLCVTGALSDGRLCRRLAPAQPDASACRFLLWEVRSHWGGAQFPTLNPTTTIFCFIFTLQIIGSLMIKLIQSFFLLVQSLPSLRFLGILSEWVFDNNTGGQKIWHFLDLILNFCVFLLTIFCTKSIQKVLWNIWYYHLKWLEMLYLAISWCYGSKNILWIQSVLGLLGLWVGVPGLLNKIVDFGGPKWHLES